MNNNANSEKFSEQLNRYMRRIRSSANSVANAIDVSRQTVSNWREGATLPKEEMAVIKCADFLRLTDEEKRNFIQAAGFNDNKNNELSYLLFKDYITASIRKLLEIPGYPIMIQFIQADLHELSLHNALLNQAEFCYGPENVLHIQVPQCSSVQNSLQDRTSYFRDIAEQCKFIHISEKVDCSDADFERALRDRVLKTSLMGSIFLLISNFERGYFEFNRSLAAVIRGLSDRFGKRFHVMICGGKGLEELALGNGTFSLLNHAERQHWPEFDLASLRTIADHKYKFEHQLPETLAKHILKVSGGHFQLISEILKLLKKQPSLNPASFEQKLSNAEDVWQVFIPLRASDETKQKICNWLSNEEITGAQPYILDDTLRYLYWKNLIIRRNTLSGEKFCWRCFLIQTVGKKVLECQNQTRINMLK